MLSSFKRGVDVPRIKSSSRLFSLKSKFRFSGRCEHELISEQSKDNSMYSSHGSVSSWNGDTSCSTNRSTLNRSGMSELSSSTVTDHNFKRRTFMQTPRSFVRPKNPPMFQPTTLIVASDTNNNEVVVSSTSLEGSPSRSPIIDGNVHPDSTLLDQSEHALKENILVDTPAQATSTPHLTPKNNNGDQIDANNLNNNVVAGVKENTPNGSVPNQPLAKKVSFREVQVKNSVRNYHNPLKSS